jgi:hypothetical protein
MRQRPIAALAAELAPVAGTLPTVVFVRTEKAFEKKIIFSI